MVLVVLVALGLSLLLAALLLAYRLADIRRRDSIWATLVSKRPWQERPFSATAVERLPPAAQRYFRSAIGQGTPIRPVAEIRSTLEATGRNGRAARFRRYQVFAIPHGVVSRIYSEDGIPTACTAVLLGEQAFVNSWWLRIVSRRRPSERSVDAMVAQLLVEAALWSPAAFLPGGPVTWEGVDHTTAKVLVVSGRLRHEIELTVDEDGRPASIRASAIGASDRPSCIATPELIQEFDGYRLPTRIVFRVLGDTVSPLSSKVTLDRIRFVGPWIGSTHV